MTSNAFRLFAIDSLLSGNHIANSERIGLKPNLVIAFENTESVEIELRQKPIDF